MPGGRLQGQDISSGSVKMDERRTEPCDGVCMAVGEDDGVYAANLMLPE